MNLNFLKKALNINGVTHLVVNKMDVLQKIENWSLYQNNLKLNFYEENAFKKYIIKNVDIESQRIHFSGTPHSI